ncbi:hypothetical protein QQP08_021555 [Theobroma cacao]|nr:hypothetical protein QQP08_021555 [Theobroma cacao]
MGKKLNQRPESESVHLGQPIERTDTLSWSTLPAAAVVDTIIHFNGPSLAFFCDNNSYPLLSTAFENDAPWEARGKNKECLLKEVPISLVNILSGHQGMGMFLNGILWPIQYEKIGLGLSGHRVI